MQYTNYSKNIFRSVFKKNRRYRSKALILTGVFAFSAIFSVGCGDSSSSLSEGGSGLELLNVSYDPTREFYAKYNELFSAHWEEETGEKVNVTQSHGGSGAQARSVIEGNEADVVTLALAHDITMIEEAGMIESGWMDG